MKSLIVTVAVTALAVLLATNECQAHPFHVSIAEAEWNASSKTIEVALRVDPVDLELALRRRFRKPVDLDKTRDIEKLIAAWLQDTFVVRNADKKESKLDWVGCEITLKEAWLYFEFPAEAGWQGLTISNEVFFERLNGQANTVNFTAGRYRQSFTLTRNRTSQELKKSDRVSLQRNRRSQRNASRRENPRRSSERGRRARSTHSLPHTHATPSSRRASDVGASAQDKEQSKTGME